MKLKKGQVGTSANFSFQQKKKSAWSRLTGTERSRLGSRRLLGKEQGGRCAVNLLLLDLLLSLHSSAVSGPTRERNCTPKKWTIFESGVPFRATRSGQRTFEKEKSCVFICSFDSKAIHNLQESQSSEGDERNGKLGAK